MKKKYEGVMGSDLHPRKIPLTAGWIMDGWGISLEAGRPNPLEGCGNNPGKETVGTVVGGSRFER